MYLKLKNRARISVKFKLFAFLVCAARASTTFVLVPRLVYRSVLIYFGWIARKSFQMEMNSFFCGQTAHWSRSPGGAVQIFSQVFYRTSMCQYKFDENQNVWLPTEDVDEVSRNSRIILFRHTFYKPKRSLSCTFQLFSEFSNKMFWFLIAQSKLVFSKLDIAQKNCLGTRSNFIFHETHNTL